MKLFAKFSTLIAVLALIAVVAVPLQASAALPDNGVGTSQTKTQAKNCVKAYDGHGEGKGTDGKLTAKLKNQYDKDKCDQSKGGNCDIAKTTEGGVRSVINCVSPNEDSGDTGSTGSSDGDSEAGSVDQIKDPALSEGAICTTDNCELVTNYINPFITVMTVLVGIAIAIGIIFGAIQVITSAGDPQKNASGKDHIRNALIALIGYIILFAFLQWIVPGGIGS